MDYSATPHRLKVFGAAVARWYGITEDEAAKVDFDWSKVDWNKPAVIEAYNRVQKLYREVVDPVAAGDLRRMADEISSLRTEVYRLNKLLEDRR